METVLKELAAVVESRKSADPAGSYVAGLLAAGRERILRKVGEEATEVIIAGLNGSDDDLVHEVADLWFHCVVLLASRDLGPGAVLAELERRQGQSGLAEKAARGPAPGAAGQLPAGD